MEDQVINRAADNMRILSAAMVETAKSGHPGGAMGGADFIQVLFSEYLRFDPDRMDWPNRDRFFLDPGHMSPMLYSILHLLGKFTTEEIKQFRQWGSPTPGHPELDVKRGVENTSGPLGQGHAMAVGAAIAERFLVARFGEWMAHKTFTFISDGGIQEEISQGAGRLAGFLGLQNLVMFYDSNDIQLSTSTNAVTCEDTAAKYRSWGWKVITINGHNLKEIRSALDQAIVETCQPVLIIGKTVMGKGCLTESGESFEGQSSTHGQPISKAGASFSKTITHLGGDPSNPFQVFDDVAEYFTKVLKRKKAEAQSRYESETNWRRSNPQRAAILDSWLESEMPKVDWRSISFKPGLATREASGLVLSELAGVFENLIVMSADLANSDKTDGYLKNTTAMSHQNFQGAFLHAGVSELTMAAVANGMALHGGVRVACGTFFVFSDYMKPAVRLAALMELPVIYIWTHDAFRVGEDGPTHQPIEHEAQLRLLEHLKNHSGRPSVLVFRPADSAETVHAWRLALENNLTPTALVLSRQGIVDLPGLKGTERYDVAANIHKGAYVVNEATSHPDVLLIGNGSEVSTLLAGATMLHERSGLSATVVSVPSEALFRLQDPDYQQGVLTESVPRFGLTAGLPVTLSGLTGERGIVWGLDHFGYSAPAQVLDEKFGFTPEKVYEQVMAMLQKKSR